jgi:hypothetical protein
MAQKRKALTLDLNAAAGVGPSGLGNFSKKSKLAASHILTSPDVQKLKLSSPELAEFLTRNPTLATPTPSGGNYIFPKTVTEEQESYVKGFEVALKNLQHQEIPNQIITGSHVGLPSVIKSEPLTRTSIETIEKATAAHRASAAATSAKLAPVVSIPEVGKSFTSFSIPEVSPRPESSASGSMDSAELRIKEEMDDADLDQEDFDDDDSYSDEEKPAPKKGRGSGSKKITPINMESQEKIKLERKRMRNRLAASKCRKRKLERISQLELKVKDLKGENSELYNVVKKLKQSVANLKQEVIDHCNSGCQINGDVLNFSTS